MAVARAEENRGDSDDILTHQYVPEVPTSNEPVNFSCLSARLVLVRLNNQLGHHHLIALTVQSRLFQGVQELPCDTRKHTVP
jgi:hypothetical protein